MGFKDESCPAGDECGVHFRQDRTVTDERSEYISAISYVGDYAVVTADNPSVTEDLTWVATMMLGIASGKSPQEMREEGHEVPYLFYTCVYRVGDGCLADLVDAGKSVSDMVFNTEYDEYDRALSLHEMAIQAVKDGSIV